MRAPLALLLLFALALGLSACGSEESSAPVSEDAVALAANTTGDLGSYKADISSTIEVAGQSLEMEGTGEFDSAAQRGHASYTTTVAGQTLDLEFVYALPAMYIQYPDGLLPGIPEDKTWVKIDMDKLGQQQGLDLGQLMQAGQSDPSQGLQYLRGTTDIETVGDEVVRGVSTTHYKGVVDLQRFAKEDPALEKTFHQLVYETGISRIPVEVWIDEDNLVRRMKQTMEGATVGPGAQIDMTMTTELYDFGTKVDVAEPPADEVTDLEDLLGRS